jgi:hypothetical protein
MTDDDPQDAHTDPFRPPAIPTMVACLHCEQEYDSYRIEWRVLSDAEGRRHGFWCCPIPGCDGKGFGFDILPVDPTYQDERGGWVCDDEDADDEVEEEFWEDDASPEGPGGEIEPRGKESKGEDDVLPW